MTGFASGMKYTPPKTPAQRAEERAAAIAEREHSEWLDQYRRDRRARAETDLGRTADRVAELRTETAVTLSAEANTKPNSLTSRFATLTLEAEVTAGTGAARAEFLQLNGAQS